MDDLYPLGPQNIPVELTTPTTTYKHKAWLAVISLAMFVLIYIALAGWFVWTAYRLVGESLAAGQNVILNLIIGACAAFLSLFMLKALFFLRRGSASDALEITEKEQPRLFAFLHRLADEAGAPRPRRVYLSARVNAAVSYDLSILNLIFPSKKNLEIGLALVNVLTLSEFKAVIAHEFGHFAQRSMAIGRWVYVAQQIATHITSSRNMVDEFLQGLSRIDIRIAWIGWILSLIVWSIRSLMDSLLRVVILAQRALSRQMEFQADIVSVSLTGSDELVHALHKLQAADDAWTRTLSFTNDQLRQNRKPNDLFTLQTEIIEKMGRILGDLAYGSVPAATDPEPAKHRIFKSSFAQPPQMWATHPTNADRENNAKARYLTAPHDPRSAWLLFDHTDQLRQEVGNQIFKENSATPSSPEETLEALNTYYAIPQFETRYRGAYLGRTLTRYSDKATELYDTTMESKDVLHWLDHLYPVQLATDLAKLRDLREEKVLIEALRDKVYQPSGGRITYRGRDIRRRDIPQAILEITKEEMAVNGRIITHDKGCRSVHLRAVAEFGNGWDSYLTGLIGVLHYAEHTGANLKDVYGAFTNEFSMVTGGKTSISSLDRLILVNAANRLQAVLFDIHHQKSEIHLDSLLCEKLKIGAWSEALGELKLPQATETNIGDWLKVVDSWFNAYASSLNALFNVALQQLLSSEDTVAAHFRAGTKPDNAPLPSHIPEQYSLLLPGQERERQKRKEPWDRFQTADGWLPGIARFLVAGAIVGGVLGFGGTAGINSTVSIYNGLAQTVSVTIGREHFDLAPFQAIDEEIELSDAGQITTATKDGETIESFTPSLSGHTQHYIYNIAAATPLVQWIATYGQVSGTLPPPRFLGNPRWTTTHIDIVFEDPPHSVQTPGGGGSTRTVLTAAGNLPPDKTLRLVQSDKERLDLIRIHARWDQKSPYAAEWQALAQKYPSPSYH